MNSKHDKRKNKERQYHPCNKKHDSGNKDEQERDDAHADHDQPRGGSHETHNDVDDECREYRAEVEGAFVVLIELLERREKCPEQDGNREEVVREPQEILPSYEKAADPAAVMPDEVVS